MATNFLNPRAVNAQREKDAGLSVDAGSKQVKKDGKPGVDFFKATGTRDKKKDADGLKAALKKRGG